MDKQFYQEQKNKLKTDLKHSLILLAFILTIIVCPNVAVAQVSLVPANHSVYEWLHHQRVIGNAPSYNHETLPLSRGKLVSILKKIEIENLGHFDTRHLTAYLNELAVERLKEQSSETLIQGENASIGALVMNKTKYFLSDVDEKHLYAHGDSVSNAAVDIWWGEGYINSSSANASQTKGGYNFLGIRSYGSFYGKVGYHVDYQNVTALGGNKTLQRHPVWQNTWSMKRGQTSTIYGQVFGSFQMGKLRLDIGRGMINYGPGVSTIILSREAPDFDWVRLSWKSKYVDYDYMHGTLQSFGNGITTVDSTLAGTTQAFKTRLRVARWLVMRRLTLKPAHWMALSYSQTSIYSNRGIDISHLNPFLPVDIAEINNQDLDNPSIYLDLIVRPFKSVELFGSIGASDLNKKSDIFKKTGNRSSDFVGVLAHAAGINISLKTGTDFKVEYTQLDPYFYTHKFLFNTYENFDKSLGAQFGPNADQWYFSLRQWLPRRSWVQAGLKHVRHGFNIIDADGNVSFDVGGDLFEPQQPGGDKVLFLKGDLHKYNDFELMAQMEPLRAFRINMVYNKRLINQGKQLQNNDYVEVSISIGY